MISKLRTGVLLGLLALTVVFASQGKSFDQESCDSSKPHGIGKSFSPELADEARHDSGAASVRPMGPSIPSSADSRSDRLNVLLDKTGTVVGFRCG
jgi:hypothetical protein